MKIEFDLAIQIWGPFEKTSMKFSELEFPEAICYLSVQELPSQEKKVIFDIQKHEGEKSLSELAKIVSDKGISLVA